MKTKVIDEEKLCYDYDVLKYGIYDICEKYKIGKIRAFDILAKHGISKKTSGGQSKNFEFVVADHKIEKYKPVEGKHYVVSDKNTDFTSHDIKNRGGFLTSYINKQYGVQIPSLYDRNKYYKMTGNYWWEQWLTVELVDDKKTKKCPYCDWETYDIDNLSGSFEVHLKNKHGMTVIEYLEEYPEDKEYFIHSNPLIDLQKETDPNKFVACKICGKKLTKISNIHLKTHGIDKNEYIRRFGSEDMMCKETYDKFKALSDNMNLVLSNNTKERFTSKAESEIMEVLSMHGFKIEKNRSILNGSELDIYIESKKFAIEYNGVVWHSENYGKKDSSYHLNKFNRCKEKGVRLVHVYDDEYRKHKDLIIDKILTELGVELNKKQINVEDCTFEKICVKDNIEPIVFFNNNHISDYNECDFCFVARKEKEIVYCMSFKSVCDEYKIIQYANDYQYNTIGFFSKMVDLFFKEHPKKKLSVEIDRVWLFNSTEAEIIENEFCFSETLEPDYSIINRHVHIIDRINKDLFYNEKEIDENDLYECGYDKVWNCGKIKYVHE